MPDGSCGCDFCQHWSPLIERIQSKLSGEELALFDELVNDWMSAGEDLSVANARLDGSWSGREEMKHFEPKDPS
jgi:hypothetical protein